MIITTQLPTGEWQAIDSETYDYAEDTGAGPEGRGDTAIEAVADLLDQLMADIRDVFARAAGGVA